MIILYVYFLIFLSVVLFVSDYYERLCELRTEKGISQKEAARDLSVSQALLSHYERGIREFGLDFLNRAADYYGVTTDYLLGRSDSRSGLNSEYLEDRTEDGKFTAQTVYRAAIMTHERMNAGSSTAGEKTDLLYAAAVYSTLFAAAQKGYIPKRWFSLPAKYAVTIPHLSTDSILSDFPEKMTSARRYGGPEPLCIETVIKTVENAVKRYCSAIADKV